MKAKANIPTKSPYKSDGERAFFSMGQGEAILKYHFKCEVIDMAYEPETFNLPGGRYTPDFRVILSDGRIIFIETKGSKKQRGYRETRIKLHEAVNTTPWYTWVEVRLTKISRGIIKDYEIEVLK